MDNPRPLIKDTILCCTNCPKTWLAKRGTPYECPVCGSADYLTEVTGDRRKVRESVEGDRRKK